MESVPAAHSESAEAEAALIRRCCRGERAAFDALASRYAPRIYNLALRLAGNADDASDAAQEALVRAFKAIRKFRFQCAFSTWLYRIAVNTCLDEMKRRKRRPSLLTDLESDPREGGPESRAPNADPESLALERMRRGTILAAVAALPPVHRVVIVLYDLQGHSYEEIGAMLDLPLGTVKSRLNRARLALRAALAPHMELIR